MKIEVTIMCPCGSEIEEIYGAPCDKMQTEHRHGQCAACGADMICVCQLPTAQPSAELH